MRLDRVGAALAGAVVAAGAFAVLAPSAQNGTPLIRVTATEVKFSHVDVGPKGVSPGDVEISAQAISNLKISKRPIGSGDLVCTYTIARVRSCRGTYVLPRGKLVVGADVRYREIYELAILGGTGIYTNAGGTLTATRIVRLPKRREYLIFRLDG